jgi:luciferase family oxidoreductase, group 1
MKLSVLDLVMMWFGETPQQAIRDSIELAKYVESLGYTRYWFAEHHNAIWQASSVPALITAYTASATQRIRVGSGGVMLPNHSALSVAEQFRTLEAMHPGRIDLGIGRAPGTDGMTALALRRSRQALNIDDFPDQMEELIGFLSNSFPPDHAFRRIVATPYIKQAPPIFILGSSNYGAEFAATHGLAFAFAHHIAPDHAVAMLQSYRRSFKPSRLLSEPYSILATNAFAAESDEAAENVAAMVEIFRMRLRSGALNRPPTPEDVAAYRESRLELGRPSIAASNELIGAIKRVGPNLRKLAEAGQVDEIMITTMGATLQERCDSYRLFAQEFNLQIP